MQRRVMSCTGPTLLPLDRNKARVLTVAVLETPRMRPLICSDVSAVHRLLCATRSPVRLSNSITAGARNSSASSSFRHSSSSPGKVVGVPRCGVAKAVISSHRYDLPEPTMCARDMEHRRMRQAGADGRGEHRRQGRGQVGYRCAKLNSASSVLEQRQRGLGLRAGRVLGDRKTRSHRTPRTCRWPGHIRPRSSGCHPGADKAAAPDR